MRGHVNLLAACGAVLGLAGAGSGQTDICWDNDFVPNGENAQAMSPPKFPFIRVVDDFTVPEGEPWQVCDFHIVAIEESGWEAVLPVEIFIYNDASDCPGTLQSIRETEDVVREFEGYQLFDRDVYSYRCDFPCEELAPGKYHIGSRWPAATGSGTNYWLTSNGGEGRDESGCFSIDSGQTWQSQGPDWHMAFLVTGICDTGCQPCYGDVNEDCTVGFSDLLVVLAAWGTCPDFRCAQGGTCDNYPPCGDEGCFCFRLFDGGTFCGVLVDCEGLQPCPNGICPPGFVCQTDTCCEGGDVCVSADAGCDVGAPPARHLPGTITNAGIVGEDGTVKGGR